MVLVQASKLSLPQSPTSPPQILSANYEPSSHSLALTHSDSSISLYSSVAPLSEDLAGPETLTLISPPVSSSDFVLLQSNSSTDSEIVEDPRALFVAASPLQCGASVCLRFYSVRKGSEVFSKVKVICKQKFAVFDEKLGAVVVKVNHGVAIRVSGDVNLFTMYSVSNARIWVLAVKMVSDDDDDGVVVKLMKCAVIECKVPVWSISVFFGYLILGEDNGVRVFALRPLVKGLGNKRLMYDSKHKGRVVKGKHMGQTFEMPNGVVRVNAGGVMEGRYKKLDNGHDVGAKIEANRMTTESSLNDHFEQKSDRHHASAKLRSIRVGHESGIFKSFDVVNAALPKSTNAPITTAKAISVKAMSANKFLILDSLGNLHLLSMSKLAGLKLDVQMRQLPQFMKVQKIVVLPGTQTVWSSDGLYTVRMMIFADIDPADNEGGEPVDEGNPSVSGNQLIFTSEKIQDVVSLSAKAVLIFGQGSMFIYSIS